MENDPREPATVLGALHDPVRARLYRFVRRQDHAVTREQAAEAVGISRKLAAFHLDKLVAAGLLAAGDVAQGRRRVPGRAPKLYTPARGEWHLSVPPRRYPLLAEILVDAVRGMGEQGRSAARRAAVGAGRGIGQEALAGRRLGRLGTERALALAAEVLDEAGYEPRRGPESISLGNCPFAQLASGSPDLVCALNRDLISGLLEGLNASPPLDALLVDGGPGCCVEVCARGRARPQGSGRAA